MLVSGFIDGKLIYILEFPFTCSDFVENLKIQIKKWSAKLKGSKTTKGQFLRSATFDYRNFIKCPDLKIIFLLNKKELAKYRKYISNGFYEFLLKHAKNE